MEALCDRKIFRESETLDEAEHGGGVEVIEGRTGTNRIVPISSCNTAVLILFGNRSTADKTIIHTVAVMI